MTQLPRWMTRLPTPAWIEQDEQLHGAISLEVRQKLLNSWPLILNEIESALRWALVEDNPGAYLKSEDVKECKGYCLGRRLFEQKSGPRYWIEIECCFLMDRPDGTEFAWERCIVTLLWNTEQRQGQLARSRVTEHSAKLSQLHYRLASQFELESSQSFVNADAEAKAFFEKYWVIILSMLPKFAQQVVEDGGFSGELDNEGFPSCASMTGEFEIEDSFYISEGLLTLLLRFRQRRQFASQTNFDYLGEELGISIVDGIPQVKWNNTSVI